MRSTLAALILVLLAMVSIQYGAALAKGFFPLAGPAGVTALRVTFSAIIISVLSRVWTLRLTSSQLFWVMLYGFSLGAMNLLFYYSLERIPLGIAVAVEFIGPLGVAVYFSRRGKDFIWILLSVVGLIFLLLPETENIEALDRTGVLLALAAGLFWGLYIIFGKRVSAHADTLKLSGLGMIFASAIALSWGLATTSDRVLNWQLWPTGLMVALLSSAIPYSLELKAMKRLPAQTFGVLMSLEPVMALIVGSFFLHEKITPVQGVSMGLIVAASIGSAVTARRNK